VGWPESSCWRIRAPPPRFASLTWLSTESDLSRLGATSLALAPASDETSTCPRMSTSLSTVWVSFATWQAVRAASPVIMTSCWEASLRCSSVGAEPSFTGVEKTCGRVSSLDEHLVRPSPLSPDRSPPPYTPHRGSHEMEQQLTANPAKASPFSTTDRPASCASRALKPPRVPAARAMTLMPLAVHVRYALS